MQGRKRKAEINQTDQLKFLVDLGIAHDDEEVDILQSTRTPLSFSHRPLPLQ